MNQFDVYANADSDRNQAYPYFVDVQTELIDVFEQHGGDTLNSCNDR